RHVDKSRAPRQTWSAQPDVFDLERQKREEAVMGKRLSGKTAVVTGASSGIGRAIAERLGGEGAHVFLSGRTRDAMLASQERIERAGGRATCAVGDVRDPRHVQGLIDAAMRDTGRLDIMVNNAGVSFHQPIIEGDVEEWRTMLETNVLALLVGCQAAIRAMR